MVSELTSWDLESTQEAMSTFRTLSNDFYDYMEAILLENKTQLAIRFSGGENNASILINFALRSSKVGESENDPLRRANSDERFSSEVAGAKVFNGSYFN